MNIYYSKRQHLDVLSFWNEILKMSVVPILISSFALYFTHNICKIETWQQLGLGVAAYGILYILLFMKFSMNKSECQLLIEPIKRIIRK